MNLATAEVSGASLLVIGVRAFHPSLPCLFYHLPQSLDQEKYLLDSMYDREVAEKVRFKVWNPVWAGKWRQITVPAGSLLPTEHLPLIPEWGDLSMTMQEGGMPDLFEEISVLVAAMHGILGQDRSPVPLPWSVASEVQVLGPHR